MQVPFIYLPFTKKVINSNRVNTLYKMGPNVPRILYARVNSRLNSEEVNIRTFSHQTFLSQATVIPDIGTHMTEATSV